MTSALISHYYAIFDFDKLRKLLSDITIFGILAALVLYQPDVHLPDFVTCQPCAFEEQDHLKGSVFEHFFVHRHLYDPSKHQVCTTLANVTKT